MKNLEKWLDKDVVLILKNGQEKTRELGNPEGFWTRNGRDD